MTMHIKKQDGDYIQVSQRDTIAAKNKTIALFTNGKAKNKQILGEYPNRKAANAVLEKIQIWWKLGTRNIFIMP